MNNEIKQVQSVMQDSISLMNPQTSEQPLADEDMLKAWKKMLSISKDKDDCFFGNHPTLREMNVSTGRKVAQFYVSTLLSVINEATNYKVKFSELQINMLTELIYDKFSYLKDTEITLFFYELFRHANKDLFFGSLEIETIMEELTRFVLDVRGQAIHEHDEQLALEKIETEKDQYITWEDLCVRKGISVTTEPIEMMAVRLNNKIHHPAKDSVESITKSATTIIQNKDGYDEATLIEFRSAFTRRYGYTPEDYLRKEGLYE